MLAVTMCGEGFSLRRHRDWFLFAKSHRIRTLPAAEAGFRMTEGVVFIAN
jgi:hypothetical protein